MNSRFRNWSDVRVFLAVVREGSTLAASKVLGMAQPTVARRIDVLEHELGLTLFSRDTRGFTPTEAGKALIPSAQEIEAAAKGFADQALMQARTLPIRLTAFAENLSTATTDILSEFSLAHPDVTFEFLPNTLMLDLMKGEADVAIRISFSEQDPALVAHHISTAKFTIFAAPSYIAKHGMPRSPAELKDHAVYTLRRAGMPSALHDWVVRHAGADAIKGSYSEVVLLDVAIRSGHGIGIKNVRQAQPEVAAGTLVPCFDPPSELQAKHQILIAPKAYQRPEVRNFAKFFVPRYAALFQ